MRKSGRTGESPEVNKKTAGTIRTVKCPVSFKKCAALVCVFLLLFQTGCGAVQGLFSSGPESYETSVYDYFDTVTTIKGYAESEEEFTSCAQTVCAELEKFNSLFDIYNDYEGVNNLKTVNDNAGIKPVEVEEEVISLLLFGKEIYEESGGKVNIFMGSVLRLWHEARETADSDPAKAYVPSAEALARAAEHTDPARCVIDEENRTVYLEDPEMSVDAGAVAKGYAAEKAREKVPGGYVLNLGGNICISGPKPDGSDWIIGIQDPDSDGYLEKLSVNSGSVVTSGDYQRYFTCDGIRYHHIIDPETLFPADRWRSVTIIADDSGTADFLSTAMFLKDRQEGEALLEKYGAEACWVDADGEIFMSDGFEAFLSGN